MSRLDVLPHSAMDDVCDGGHVDFKSQTNGSMAFACGGGSANGQNHCICQVRFVLLFTKRISPLCHAIRNVVCMRSQEQMIWIDARRVVAAMQHIHTNWNWTVRQLPRKPMGEHSKATLPIIGSECSIATTVACACPMPASIRRTFDLRPESGLYGSVILGLHRTLLTFVAVPGMVTAIARRFVAPSIPQFWLVDAEMAVYI